MVQTFVLQKRHRIDDFDDEELERMMAGYSGRRL